MRHHLTIEVTATRELVYDDQAPEFKESLSSFNELIADGDAEDMVRHVAAQLREWGDHQNMIEGVGYVGLIGGPIPAKAYCGIQVNPSYAEYDYD